jgi:DNA-binding PucR family transcriptional regulator
MNITQTAKELFIHRSTLLERLKHIEDLLQLDLKHPDVRLYLNMTLKIIENNSWRGQ